MRRFFLLLYTSKATRTTGKNTNFLKSIDTAKNRIQMEIKLNSIYKKKIINYKNTMREWECCVAVHSGMGGFFLFKKNGKLSFVSI